MPIGCYVADYSGHAHRRHVFGRADDPGYHRPKIVLGYSSASAATCTVCRYPCNMQRCGVNNKRAGALALSRAAFGRAAFGRAAFGWAAFGWAALG
jgi:hypothetical protein